MRPSPPTARAAAGALTLALTRARAASSWRVHAAAPQPPSRRAAGQLGALAAITAASAAEPPMSSPLRPFSPPSLPAPPPPSASTLPPLSASAPPPAVPDNALTQSPLPLELLSPETLEEWVAWVMTYGG